MNHPAPSRMTPQICKQKHVRANQMPKISRNLLKVLFVAAAFFAIYKELQAVAIAAFVGTLLTFGWRQVKFIRDAIVPIVAATRRAKVSGFEIELHDPSSALSKALVTQPSWVRFVLSEIQPSTLGVLFLLKEKGHYAFPGGLRDSLAILRNAGLLEHNAESLQKSTTVWLSPLGIELTSRLSLPEVTKALTLFSEN